MKKRPTKNLCLAVFLKSEGHLVRFIEALKWMGVDPYSYLKGHGTKHYAIESAFPWEVFDGNWESLNDKWKKFDLNTFLREKRKPKKVTVRRKAPKPVSKWNWRKEWRKYRRRVWVLTEAQPLELLPDYYKRGFKAYHLDHRKSIWRGWKDGDPPEYIADLSNLRMIPYKQNMIKGVRCESEL